MMDNICTICTAMNGDRGFARRSASVDLRRRVGESFITDWQEQTTG